MQIHVGTVPAVSTSTAESVSHLPSTQKSKITVRPLESDDEGPDSSFSNKGDSSEDEEEIPTRRSRANTDESFPTNEQSRASTVESIDDYLHISDSEDSEEDDEPAPSVRSARTQLTNLTKGGETVQTNQTNGSFMANNVDPFVFTITSALNCFSPAAPPSPPRSTTSRTSVASRSFPRTQNAPGVSYPSRGRSRLAKPSRVQAPRTPTKVHTPIEKKISEEIEEPEEDSSVSSDESEQLIIGAIGPVDDDSEGDQDELMAESEENEETAKRSIFPVKQALKNKMKNILKSSSRGSMQDAREDVEKDINSPYSRDDIVMGESGDSGDTKAKLKKNAKNVWKSMKSMTLRRAKSSQQEEELYNP